MADNPSETMSKLITDFDSLLDAEKELASKQGAECDAKRKKLEKKLASKKTELEAEIVKIGELRKKYDQVQKTKNPIKSTVGSVIPRKRPSEEEPSVDCDVIVQNLKNHLGWECDPDIHE